MAVAPTAFYGSLVSLAVGAVGLLLAVWLPIERRSRSRLEQPEDVRHFAAQDTRRAIVALIMLATSVCLYVGSHIGHMEGGRPNPHFIEVWGAIFGLVLLLFILAAVDWNATRRYALRHRRAIVREGLEILRDEFQRRAAERAGGPVNGHLATNSRPEEPSAGGA